MSDTEVPADFPDRPAGSITMTMEAYVDSARVLVASSRLVRLCQRHPEQVTARAVLDILQTAGVQWPDQLPITPS